MIYKTIDSINYLPEILKKGVINLDKRVIVHEIHYSDINDYCIVLVSNTGQAEKKNQLNKKETFFFSKLEEDPQFVLISEEDGFIVSESFPLIIHNWSLKKVELIDNNIFLSLKKNKEFRTINIGTNRDLSWSRLKDDLEVKEYE